jgi:beta-N-acetylhexosaminidase
MNINIDELTIQEKIGQMMIVGIDKNYITERTKRLILDYKIGGVILYKKNFSSYDELINIIKELKKLNSANKIPLFISIDQEGGRVNRLPKEILNLPAAYKLAKLKDVEVINKAAELTGSILKKTGFNLDFAPVLDIKRFEDGHAIGDRSYGETKEDVIKYGIPVMEELQKQGIISVVKHFPGHGGTKKDSHFMLPKITIPKEKLEKEDMEVFKTAIEHGADAILVGHLRVKKETGIYPASLSKKYIIKNLREKYNYKGLIISDDLKMRAVKLFFGPFLSIKKAFKAGNDIIIFRFNKLEEKIAIKKINKLVRKNKIEESRIDESVKRILDTKQKYNLSDLEKIEVTNIKEINKQIDEIRMKI